MNFIQSVLLAWKIDEGEGALYHDGSHCFVSTFPFVAIALGASAWCSLLYPLLILVEVYSMTLARKKENWWHGCRDIITFCIMVPFVMFFYGLWIWAIFLLPGLIIGYFPLLLQALKHDASTR